MSRERERARQLVQETLEELGKLRNASPRDPSFKQWRQNTLTLIQRVWSADPRRSDRFRAVPFSPPHRNPDAHTIRETYQRGCVEAAGFLKGLLFELETDIQGPSAPAEERVPARLVVAAAEAEAEPAPARAANPPRNGSAAKKKKDKEKREVTFDPGAFAAEIEARVTQQPQAPEPPRAAAPPRTAAPPRAAAPPAGRATKPKPDAANFDLASLNAEFEARAQEEEPEAEPVKPPVETIPTSRERFVPPAAPPPPTIAQEPFYEKVEAEQDYDDELQDEPVPDSADDMFRNSPVFGARPAASQAPAARGVASDAPFEMPEEAPVFTLMAARMLAVIASDVTRFGVAESDRALAQANLLAVAEGLDRGEMAWPELQDVLHFVIDHPALARRVLPLLVPYLDEAA